MSRGVALRPLAEADLRAIWTYTAERWTVAQAESYLAGLGGLFALLARHPETARERQEFQPPVRLHPYRSHLVIFASNARTIAVIRVVHNRSNWADLVAD